MTWFKLYIEFATDPKVQTLNEAEQRRLVMIFCLHGAGILQTLSEDEIASALRISRIKLARTKELFVRKGFIDEDWYVTNWDKRQLGESGSAERMRRMREKRRLEREAQERHSDVTSVTCDASPDRNGPVTVTDLLPVTCDPRLEQRREEKKDLTYLPEASPESEITRTHERTSTRPGEAAQRAMEGHPKHRPEHARGQTQEGHPSAPKRARKSGQDSDK